MADALNHTTPAAVSAAPTVQEPREMVVWMARDHGFWEYHGTRAQLEAEGVIPPSMVWPVGKNGRHWETAGYYWGLRRIRPEGLKGPMKLWINGDWWSVRCEPTVRTDRALRIADMKRALDHAIFMESPAGKAALRVHWARTDAMREDKAFQRFKALIPALSPVQPRR